MGIFSSVSWLPSRPRYGAHFAQHVFVLFGYEYFMQLLLMFLVEDKFERTERILLHIQYSLLKVMTDTYLVVQYY